MRIFEGRLISKIKTETCSRIYTENKKNFRHNALIIVAIKDEQYGFNGHQKFPVMLNTKPSYSQNMRTLHLTSCFIGHQPKAFMFKDTSKA